MERQASGPREKQNRPMLPPLVSPVWGTAAKSGLVSISGIYCLTLVRPKEGPNRGAPMVSSGAGARWPASLNVYPFSEFSFLVLSSVSYDTVLKTSFSA